MTQTPAAPNSPIVSTLTGIQKSLTSITKVLESGATFQRRTITDRTQRTQADQRRVRERIVETSRSNKINPRNIPDVVKSLSPIDFIRNFVSYTFIGFVTTRLIKLYPQILSIAKFISPVTSAIEGIVGGIFNIFVSIIDRTYKVFDKIRGLSKTIGGKQFQSSFDKFSSTMNTFFNVLILAGLTLGSTLMDPKIKDSIFGRKAGLAGRGGRRGAGTTGMTDVQQRYLNRYGQSAYQSKFGATPSQQRYLSRYGEGKFVRRFGFRPNAPSLGGITKGGLKMASSAKFIKGNALLGVIDLIVKVASGERLDKAIVTTTGTVLGSAIGQIAGGIIGGALGLAVPFLGSAILGTAGSIAGGILGGFLGDWLGEMLYNGISSIISNKITGHAEGGYVPTRGGEPVRTTPTRTIKKLPQTPRRIPNKKVIPGKDIGGKKQLEKILKNPSDPKYKNPLRMLTQNSDVLGRRGSRGGFFMEIMKIGQDMASLGQKPDQQHIDLISDNFSIFIKNLVRDQTNRNIARTTQSMFAMANGGYVPASRTLDMGDPIGDQFKKIFRNLLSRSINAVSSDIFKNIRAELSLLDEQGGGMPGGESGMPGEISIGNFSAEDIDLLGRMIHAEAGGESDLGKAAVLAVILNRWRLIKSGQVTPGTFLTQGTKDTITLKDILYGKNQFEPVSNGSLNRTTSEQGKLALEKAIRANGNDPQKLYNNLIAQKYSPEDAEYITKAAFFATTPNSSFMRAVRLGGHVFQQARNAQFKGGIQQIPSISATINYPNITNFDAKKYGQLGGLTIENQQGTPIRSWEQLYKFGHHGEGPGGSIDTSYGMKYDFNLILPNGSTDVPLPAPISGTVITSGIVGGYGYTVIIKGTTQSDGVALIGHLKTPPFVKENSTVVAFQTIIGIQGTTGRSSGPHVHISAQKHVIERYVNFFIQLSKARNNNTEPKNLASITKILQIRDTVNDDKIQDSQIAQIQPSMPNIPSKVITDRTYDEDRYSGETKILILPIEKSVPQLV